MDQKLKNEIEKKLSKMKANLENQEAVWLRWQFVDKFILCEVACKMVMNAYHDAKNQKIALKDETLNMKVIPAAMKWAELDFTKEELDALFSGQGDYMKRGTKSAKLLRHGSMHEHNENDIQEIVDRFAELDAMMDDFLDRIHRAEEKIAQKKSTKKKAKTPAAV